MKIKVISTDRSQELEDKIANLLIRMNILLCLISNLVLLMEEVLKVK